MVYLLSDPFLQFPKQNSIEVIWFTEFAGEEHYVRYGLNLEQSVKAQSTVLSKMQEDQNSKWHQQVNQVISRTIWRHQARLEVANKIDSVPYQVTSIYQGQSISSKIFSFSLLPQTDTPLNILLSSDHQLMPMVSANLEKVAQTIAKIDAVFFAGDLVNTPDRASEWFDDARGGAFFPALQGRANYSLTREGFTRIYHGAEIIQNAPLFSAIGNHEVMGRCCDPKLSLNQQFQDAIPRQVALELYNFSQDQQNLLKEHSFNVDSYQEILGFEPYYATTFGSIRLVVLYVTNIWRHFSRESNVKGRYQEAQEDLSSPERWGYGQHIFESIAPGSKQYLWLQSELESTEFCSARYKIVMFHHPPHTVGGNIVPHYTDPIAKFTYDSKGALCKLNYDYPISKDYIVQDLLPLLEKAQVQLVFYGHSHIWNRFTSPSGMHFLESSNVGNTFGAYWDQDQTSIIPAERGIGNPNGLEPIVPNIAPVLGADGQALPYIASNDHTVFSIFNSTKGSVSSYYCDLRQPDSVVVKFDEFQLREN